jgi:hypothetical protein
MILKYFLLRVLEEVFNIQKVIWLEPSIKYDHMGAFAFPMKSKLGLAEQASIFGDLKGTVWCQI